MAKKAARATRAAQGHAHSVGKAADRHRACGDQGQEAGQGEPVRARARRRQGEIVRGRGATLRLPSGLPDDR